MIKQIASSPPVLLLPSAMAKVKTRGLCGLLMLLLGCCIGHGVCRGGAVLCKHLALELSPLCRPRWCLTSEILGDVV